MIAADHSLRDSALAHSAAVLRLVDLLRKARSAQWDPRPTERLSRFDDIVDPVAATAASTTRLQLRAAVLDAEARLQAATAAFTEATDNLEAAFDRHVDPPSPAERLAERDEYVADRRGAYGAAMAA